MLDVMRSGLALCVVMALATTASAGGTFEIGFGGGTVTTLVDGKNETAAAGSSPTIAAGGRLGDRTWLLGRISLVFAKDVSFAFFGGSVADLRATSAWA